MADERRTLGRLIAHAGKLVTQPPIDSVRFRTLQRVAGVMAPMIVVSMGFWLWESWDWVARCRRLESLAISCDPSSATRWALAILATVGAPLGWAAALYLGRFAVTARMWRRSGLVGGAFVLTSAAWLSVYVVARWLV